MVFLLFFAICDAIENWFPVLNSNFISLQGVLCTLDLSCVPNH